MEENARILSAAWNARWPADMLPAIQFPRCILCRGYGRMRVKGDIAVTTLLREAFDRASSLTPQEQDLLASRLMAELAAEDDFDRAIAASADKLAGLAREALAEDQAGLTEELDPDQL
jgi:hypothetical protein